MEMFQKSQEDGDLDKSIELVHMPLGANTDLYKPFKPTDEQKSLFNIKTKGFVFLSLFGWSLRKGVDVLFKAYLQEFTKEDDVTLLIVSRKDGCASPEKNKEIRDQIKEYIGRWSSLEDHPHIVHIGEAIPEEQLPILYNMSNCNILCSRGEGFALPLIESGSCEVPVIATRCGGQLDFLNDDNSELIDIEGYAVGCQEIKCISSYYENSPFAVLGEKATNQLKERMRYVINNYSEAKKKAKLLRENIVQNFTWDLLADKVEKQLFGK
jgi:glycosyltransferase involved in cell wall biosynthesis